ncbi:hypothetical protein BKA61DRAFT_624079 [Leptodontidium sp. MPI-SDFR-AT-0119]|nr:hypothetical protein BKA61DRAFT_624079 [Leptodontidium sp. MPI-SDFR-AT-0119]
MARLRFELAGHPQPRRLTKMKDDDSHQSILTCLVICHVRHHRHPITTPTPTTGIRLPAMDWRRSCSIHLGRASASSGCGLLSPSLLYGHNCTQFLTVIGILACTSCRSRKIACDRGQPACSRYLLSRKICEFRARKSAKPAVHSRIKAFEVRLGMSLRLYAFIQRHIVYS